jgi:hypothetical protein
MEYDKYARKLSQIAKLTALEATSFAAVGWLAGGCRQT